MRAVTGKKDLSDFTQGSVPSVVMRMSIPLILAELVNVLYNIVDRIYIGHIPGTGAAALTGVGITLPVITIFSAFAGLFGQGGAPLFSIARGRGDTEEAGCIMGNALSLLLMSSVILMILLQLISRPLLLALGGGDNTIGYALAYLHVYLMGTPLVFITLGMNPYVNAQGFARRGMMTVMLGALTNIVLDPVFIFALGMGVRGAALATVLSQAVSALWCVSFLRGKKSVLPLRRQYMPLRRRVVARIVSMGVANFIAQGTNSMNQALANRQLSLFGGELFIGAMTIINALRTAIIEIIRGTGSGVQPVLGFNYGAGEKKRVLECIRFAVTVCVGVMLVAWIVFELVPAPFVRIFTNDEDLIAVAIPAVRIYFCGNCFMALQSVGQSIFQGLGRAKYAVTFSLLRKVVIVMPLMLILPRLWNLGAWGVFWSEPVSDLLGGGACFITMLLTVYRPIARELSEEMTCKS